MNADNTINILMIEEDFDYVKTLLKSLSEIKVLSYTLEYVSSLNEAFQLSAGRKFHIILLDLFLSESKGLNTLKAVRTAEPNLPIIVLTNNDDVELAVNAVRYGAQDYLIKNKTDTHLLSLAIRYAVERKRTERFQREQLHFLQSVMDNIPSPLYIKDTNLIFGACNAAFEELMGIPKDKIIGKTVFEIFEERVSELIREKELELLSGKIKQIYELPLRKSEELVDMIFHETIHKRADGTLAGLIGVAMDISEMKNIEKSLKEAKRNLERKVKARTLKLQEANEKLKRQIIKRRKLEKLLSRERKIFIKGPVVVFRISGAKKNPVEYMSANIKQYGYHPDDFMKNKLKYSDIIHPDYRDKVIEDINEYTLHGENSFEEVFMINKKNGVSRKVYCYINIRRNQYNAASHFDGYILDITGLEKVSANFKRHKL